MKPIICSVIWFWLMSPAFAADAPESIAPFPHSCSESPYGEVCLHTFGGAKTKVDLTNITDEMCKGTTLQLFQLSSRLAAPVGDPVLLPSIHCEDVIIALPEVKEKTIFRISVKTKNADESKDTLLALYPRNLWEALQEWSEKNQLIVNDRSGKLPHLLDSYNIHYSPVKLPENKQLEQLCVWVPGKEKEPPFDCAAMLVLHEASEGLPYIDTQHFSDKIRTDVYMPMLDALKSHPLVQETFINLIQSNLKGE